jgi:hypothetical protein
MSPTQIKIAVYAGAALLAWLLHDRGAAAPQPQRVTQVLDVEANVLNKNFGLTDAQIAAQDAAAANPAVNDDMRVLIDKSNALISADNAQGDHG